MELPTLSHLNKPNRQISVRNLKNINPVPMTTDLLRLSLPAPLQSLNLWISTVHPSAPSWTAMPQSSPEPSPSHAQPPGTPVSYDC